MKSWVKNHWCHTGTISLPRRCNWRNGGRKAQLDIGCPRRNGSSQPSDGISGAGILTSPVVGATKLHHIEGAAKAVNLKLTPEEVQYLEAPYVPHPLAGVMAQNKPAAAKEKHI